MTNIPEIPDEIRREAEDLLRQVLPIPGWTDSVSVVAAALLARDQRAAEIVRSIPWHVKISESHVRARRPDEYASAILTYDKEPEARP